MNNKKRNRKGFTIVELSIVIAVIAILAAVMIPTFTNIVGKSKEAAAENNAKSLYTNYVNARVNPTVGDPADYESECYVLVDGYYVHIVNGGVKTGDTETTAPTGTGHMLLINADGTLDCLGTCDSDAETDGIQAAYRWDEADHTGEGH